MGSRMKRLTKKSLKKLVKKNVREAAKALAKDDKALTEIAEQYLKTGQDNGGQGEES